MSKERVIKICINGMNIKLSIPEEDEEVYRKAAKLLNDRIKVYNRKFSLPYADILAMVAYEMTVEEVKLETRYDTTPLSVLSKLASHIGEELDSEDASSDL